MSGCFSKPLSTFSCDELLLMKSEINEQLFLVGVGEYSGGKIYRIVQVDRYVLVYVGSTVQELSERFSGHISFIKNFLGSKLSQYIYENGGPSNFQIELIMSYPCRSKADLEQKEGYFIRLMKPLCNTNIPGKHETLRKASAVSRIYVQKILTSHSTRDYVATADVDLQQANSIIEKQAFRTATSEESLQLQKFWLDTQVKQPYCDPDVIARVFRNMINVSRIETLLNVVTEHRQPADNVLAGINPFGVLDLDSDKRLNTARCIRHICRLLSLSSSHDTTQRIPDTLMSAERRHLQESVDDVFRLHPKLKSTTSSAVNENKQLHLNINKIFGKFAGSKLRSKHSGRYMDKITYFIEVTDDFAADVGRIVQTSDR